MNSTFWICAFGSLRGRPCGSAPVLLGSSASGAGSVPTVAPFTVTDRPRVPVDHGRVAREREAADRGMSNSGLSSSERPSSMAGWRTLAPIVRAITSAWIVETW